MMSVKWIDRVTCIVLAVLVLVGLRFGWVPAAILSIVTTIIVLVWAYKKTSEIFDDFGKIED